MKKFVRYWVPVLLWMLVVFSASADTRSGPRASGIVRPILLWLYPNISPDQMDAAILMFRKCGHLAEFAVLGILLYRARVKSIGHNYSPWHRPSALFAVGIAACYAASDELHQTLVPSRQGQFSDVLLDTMGALMGLGLLWLLLRLRQRRSATPAMEGRKS